MFDRAHDAPPHPALPVLPARLADAYVISAPWGAGRAGSVWRARERDSLRDVALKLAPADLGSGNIEYRRCLHEARVLRRLAHPNVVRVLDAGDVDGVAYWVTPFLAGDTVAAALDGPMLPIDRVMTILRDVAAALDHAALNGVIHGALVPRKILLDTDGTAVVSDFRIDTLLAREPELELLPPAAYLAPELREGGIVDSRVDQYALAVIAYELLTGAGREQEVAGRSLAAIELLDLKAGRPLRPGLRVEASEVIQRATLRDPSWRYATSTDFVQALTDAIAPRTDLELPPARRRHEEEEEARAAAARRQRLQVAMLVGAACVGTYFAARTSIRDRMAMDRAAAANRRAAPVRVASAEPVPVVTPTQQTVDPDPESGGDAAASSGDNGAGASTPAGGAGSRRAGDTARRPIAVAGVDGVSGVATAAAAAATAALREPGRSGTFIILQGPDAPDATVFVDSVSRGAAPLVMPLRPGRHHLRLQPERRAVTASDTVLEIAPGQTTTVTFHLDRFATGASRRNAPALPLTPPRAPSGPSRAP